MARNGFKIFDADTHVRPDADLLGPFLAAESRQKLGRFDKYKAKNKEGAVTYLMGTRHYKRRLGAAGEEAPENKEYMAAPGGLDSWDNLWLQRSAAAHPWCSEILSAVF